MDTDDSTTTDSAPEIHNSTSNLLNDDDKLQNAGASMLQLSEPSSIHTINAIETTSNAAINNATNNIALIANNTNAECTSTASTLIAPTTSTSNSSSLESKSAINDSSSSSNHVQTSTPAVIPVIDRGHIMNVNVGILGHVDSGKTSLVKSLSTHLSTAALDKNPQSQQRGITLDLGKFR